LGIGDWAQSPSPIPNPQSPIPNPHFDPKKNLINNKNNYNYKKLIIFSKIIKLKK